MVRIKGRNLLHVKKQNMAAIREAIYRLSPISRSEIADLLSLTPPVITSNVASLMEMGVIRECAHDEENSNGKTLGRRPVKLEFIPESFYSIGIEFGPYRTNMCIVDLYGNRINDKITPCASEQYEEMVETIASDIKIFIDESRIDRGKLLGAGIVLPGFIDGDAGIIRSSFRTDWNNRALADDLEKEIGLRIKIENNTRARAIGLDLFDSEMNADSFVYFFISNGIACPMMIKNSMLSGETAGAGEAGHMVMDINGPVCDVCGKKGCLDAIASERAIRRQVASSIRSGEYTGNQSRYKDPLHPSMTEILEAQEDNDPLVSPIMDNAVNYLGVALANIINLISPRVVVVDGLIMTLAQNRKRLAAVAKENMFGLNATEVDILFKTYEAQGGAKGAAALAVKYFFLQQ